MNFYARLPTSLGELLLCSDGQALTGAWFVGQKDCPQLDGLPLPLPGAADPRAGTLNGQAIARFRIGRKGSAWLFDEEGADEPEPMQAGPVHMLQADTPRQVELLFGRAGDELNDYFSKNLRAFTIPIRLVGTPFQRRVWEALLHIPYGEVVSYGDVAVSAGLPGGHARATGVAVGRNPLTIIVPCHRVVARNGTLNGYTGGLARKHALLRLEGLESA